MKTKPTFDEMVKAQKAMFRMLCKCFALAILESKTDDQPGLMRNYDKWMRNFTHLPSLPLLKLSFNRKL